MIFSRPLQLQIETAFMDASQSRRRLADQICRLREAKGLKQWQLAEAIGAHEQTVSKWERGEQEPMATQLVAIADVLKVPVDQLLGRTGVPPEVPIRRDATTLVIEPENLAAILRAKKIDELEDFFVRGLIWGHRVSPLAQEVTPEAFEREAQRVRAHIEALGPYPKRWEKRTNREKHR